MDFISPRRRAHVTDLNVGSWQHQAVRASLTPHQILADLLDGDDERAHRIWRRYRSAVGVHRASQGAGLELSKIERRRIDAALHFGLAWLTEPGLQPLSGAAHVARACLDLLPLATETLIVYVLDRGHRPIRKLVIAGGVDRVIASPADVMRSVYAAGGTGFILVHNHPSGDPSPSEADLRFTDKVRRAARTCHLHFVDHVIVARGGWRSLRSRGVCG